MTTTNGNTTIPASIRNSESYKHAVTFMEKIEKKEGVEYDWIFDYAKSLWSERLQEFSSLDNKADSIIKYLGGGLGLFSIGLLAKLDAGNAYLIFWALPSVVSAVVSISLAAWARKPNAAPVLPPIENAVSCAEEEKDSAKARTVFLGQWNLACEGHRLANQEKAWKLELATLAYCLALGLLALPLLATAYFSYSPH